VPSAKPQARATSSDRRILQAARRLFVERGLVGVNMDLIASEAGVARQTIYNRFDSKEAVFEAALTAHWESLGDALMAHLDTEGDPAVVLRQVADDVLRFIDDHDQIAMTRMVIAESRFMPKLAQDFYRLGKAPLFKRFVAYLDQAHKIGRLRIASPDLAAHQFLGMIQEPLLWPKVIGVSAASKVDEAEVVQSAIAVFLKAYAIER